MLQTPEFPGLLQRTTSSQLNYLQNTHSWAGLQWCGRVFWKKSRLLKTKIFCCILPSYFLLLIVVRKWKRIILSQFSCLLATSSSAHLAGNPGLFDRQLCQVSCSTQLVLAPQLLCSSLGFEQCILANCLHKLTTILSLAFFKATMGPRGSKFQHWNPCAAEELRLIFSPEPVKRFTSHSLKYFCQDVILKQKWDSPLTCV